MYMTLWGHGRRAPGRWGTGSPRRPPPPGPGRTRRWTRLSPRPRARMSRRSRARRPQLRACLARRRAPGWRASWAGRRPGPSCARSGWAGWARTAAAAAPAACPALRRPRPAARPATAPRLRRSLTLRPEPGRATSGEGSTAGRRRCTAPSVPAGGTTHHALMRPVHETSLARLRRTAAVHDRTAIARQQAASRACQRALGAFWAHRHRCRCPPR